MHNISTLIGLHQALALLCSSKFSWHNTFVNFVTRHPITKLFLTKIYNSHSGRGFTTGHHKFFVTEMNICVIFSIFPKFLDRENLELYGIVWKCTMIRIQMCKRGVKPNLLRSHLNQFGEGEFKSVPNESTSRGGLIRIQEWATASKKQRIHLSSLCGVFASLC